MSEHTGHSVHPHDHSGNKPERKPYCSGRWFCQDCVPDPSQPKVRGVWFDGPLCKPPLITGRHPRKDERTVALHD